MLFLKTTPRWQLFSKVEKNSSISAAFRVKAIGFVAFRAQNNPPKPFNSILRFKLLKISFWGEAPR